MASISSQMPASPATTLDPGRRRRQHRPELFTHFSPPAVPSGNLQQLPFSIESYIIPVTVPLSAFPSYSPYCIHTHIVQQYHSRLQFPAFLLLITCT